MTKKLIPRKKRGGILKGQDSLIVKPLVMKPYRQKDNIKINDRNMVYGDKGWEDAGTELAQIEVTPDYTLVGMSPYAMINHTIPISENENNSLGRSRYYPKNGKYLWGFYDFKTPLSWHRDTKTNWWDLNKEPIENK